MHEANFTEQIVTSLIEELRRTLPAKPKKVRVKVGEIFHLVKESVLFHYALLTQDTDLKDIEIELQEEPVTVQCNSCSAVGGVEDHHLLLCSSCHSRDVKIISGNKIQTELIGLRD